MTTPNELRAIAEAATPGSWIIEGGANSHLFEARIMAGDECVAFADGDIERGEDDDVFTPSTNARFIATFAPPTVLALLDRLAALEAERAAGEARVVVNHESLSTVMLQCWKKAGMEWPGSNRLADAVIASLAKQEPGA